MKQFAVFAFDSYYPGGGWEDFKGSYDTYEEAEAIVENDYRDPNEPIRGRYYDYYQIVDLHTGKVTNFN